MELFPRSFLLVFAEIAVGGFFSLSIPSFREIDRGYYKSSGAVFLGLGLLGFVGRVTLWYGARDTHPVEIVEIVLLAAFLAAGAGYLWTLWSDAGVLRPRFFAGAWMLGFGALIAAAESFRPPGSSAIAAVLYPLCFAVSALLLGSVTAGMLLGHWYLIDRDLSLRPFWRMLRFYVGCLVVQAGLLAVGVLLLALAGGSAAQAVAQLAHDHVPLLLIRLAASPIAAGILGLMIWRTLQIPQTMAATGLFYIAILAVVVGEFLGRFILFRTGLPM
jgi:hypothetical protein